MVKFEEMVKEQLSIHPKYEWYNNMIEFLESVSYETSILITDDIMEGKDYFSGTVGEFFYGRDQDEDKWNTAWDSFVVCVVSIQEGALLIRALS